MLYFGDATQELVNLVVGSELWVPVPWVRRGGDEDSLRRPVDKPVLHGNLALWIAVEDAEQAAILEIASVLFKEHKVMAGIAVEPLTHRFVPDPKVVVGDGVVNIPGLVQPGLTIVNEDGGLLEFETAAFMSLVLMEELAVGSESDEMLVVSEQVIAMLTFIDLLLDGE